MPIRGRKVNHHPKAPIPRALSDVPWSPELERDLRNEKLFCLGASLVAGFLGFAAAFAHLWIVAAFCFVLAAVAIVNVAIRNERLGEMMLNKPRTAYGMTRWRQHPQAIDDNGAEILFHCECGALYGWRRDAQEFPETGRRSLICKSCGLGHWQPLP